MAIMNQVVVSEYLAYLPTWAVMALAALLMLIIPLFTPISSVSP